MREGQERVQINRLQFPNYGDFQGGLWQPQGKKKYVPRPSAIHSIIFSHQMNMISREEYQDIGHLEQQIRDNWQKGSALTRNFVEGGDSPRSEGRKASPVERDSSSILGNSVVEERQISPQMPDRSQRDSLDQLLNAKNKHEMKVSRETEERLNEVIRHRARNPTYLTSNKFA